MSNESEIRKYLAEREAISKKYMGIKENEPIPAEKPKKPTIQSLEARIRVRDRTIADLKQQLKELSQEAVDCQNQMEHVQNAFLKFKEDVEELIGTCIRIEWLSASVDKTLDVHNYLARVCEDLLQEIRKLGEKYAEQRKAD